MLQMIKRHLLDKYVFREDTKRSSKEGKTIFACTGSSRFSLKNLKQTMKYGHSRIKIIATS